MFRRRISILVLTGFIASQLATIPHAHGAISATDQQKHDTTPHFHLGAHCHGDHGHSHSPSGHRHTPTEQPNDNANVRPSAAGPNAPAHDSDAFYFSAHAVGPLATIFQGSKAPVDQIVFALMPVSDIADRWSSQPAAPRWRPPDKVLDASNTYLTLRNLRI